MLVRRACKNQAKQYLALAVGEYVHQQNHKPKHFRCDILPNKRRQRRFGLASVQNHSPAHQRAATLF